MYGVCLFADSPLFHHHQHAFSSISSNLGLVEFILRSSSCQFNEWKLKMLNRLIVITLYSFLISAALRIVLCALAFPTNNRIMNVKRQRWELKYGTEWNRKSSEIIKGKCLFACFISFFVSLHRWILLHHFDLFLLPFRSLTFPTNKQSNVE